MRKQGSLGGMCKVPCGVFIRSVDHKKVRLLSFPAWKSHTLSLKSHFVQSIPVNIHDRLVFNRDVLVVVSGQPVLEKLHHGVKSK